MASPLSRDPIAQAREQWISHGWEAEAEPMAAITAVMRTASIYLQRADSILKPHGLTFARFEVLALLGFSKRGSLPMSQASELLQVHATSLTNSVDRLESTGLVRRMAHPTDGRTRLLELTKQGQQVLNALAMILTNCSLPRAISVLRTLPNYLRSSPASAKPPETSSKVSNHQREI